MSNSGFVIIDKVAGETSFKSLFPLKKVFGTKRVGHAGTLDLRASGLIIAAIGRSTRLLPFIEAKSKCYSFRLHLGYETDTLEWDGDVVNQDTNKDSTYFSQSKLESILPKFIGDIMQVPPKYCAVKVNGVRASDLAERGRNVELCARKINISSLKIIDNAKKNEGCSGIEFATFDLICECSKGTYIRALGRDIARALNTFGCVSKIRRLRIGNITLDKAVRGSELSKNNLVPVENVLDFPVVVLDNAQLVCIRQGNWIEYKELGDCSNLFVADTNRQVVAFCKYETGRIVPKIYLAEDK